MAHKSPFTDEIYNEWDKLVLNNGAKLKFAERYQGWQKLQAMCFQNGKWIVEFDDAGLVASLGYTLAMERRDWLNARMLANQYLSHPEANSFPNEPGLPSAHGTEIAAGILCGDIVASTQKCIHLIDSKAFGRGSKMFLQISINNLVGVLYELGPKSPLSPELHDYSFELMKRFPGFKKRASEVQAMTTYQQVIDWVDAILKENWERNNAAWTKRVKRQHPEFEG